MAFLMKTLKKLLYYFLKNIKIRKKSIFIYSKLIISVFLVNNSNYFNYKTRLLK